MSSILKFIFVFLLMVEYSYAATESEQLAKRLAEATNKANASFSNSANDTVKTYDSEAIGNMVIHHRQELTKSKNDLLKLKNRYIDAYQQNICSFIKPALEEGVVIKVNTYEKNGNLAFTFIVKCK